MDTDDGLFVPALRNADMLDGAGIRTGIQRLLYFVAGGMFYAVHQELVYTQRFLPPVGNNAQAFYRPFSSTSFFYITILVGGVVPFVVYIGCIHQNVQR